MKYIVFMFQISEEDNPAMAPIIESLQAMKEQKSSTQIQNESFSVRADIILF